MRIFRFCNSKVPPPPNPTMYESFGTKISKADLEKFMNPLGFMSEEEQLKFKKEQEAAIQKAKTVETKTPAFDTSKMAPEYGYKVNGPEPTRYGDWERKGRVTDF